MKIKVASNKWDSYIGCNAYFSLNTSDSALALVNEVFEGLITIVTVIALLII
jgi:hypothetical protein